MTREEHQQYEIYLNNLKEEIKKRDRIIKKLCYELRYKDDFDFCMKCNKEKFGKDYEVCVECIEKHYLEKEKK